MPRVCARRNDPGCGTIYALTASNTRRRLRVLTLIDRPVTSGGGERMASTLAAAVDPERFDRLLCSSRSHMASTFEDTLDAAGVRVLLLDRRSKVDLASWRPLYDLLRRERVDILHAHKFGSNLWGTIIGRLARVPVVVAHEHTWSYEGQPVRRLLDRHVIARGADAFVAVSREDQRRMIEIERVPPDVIRFLPNGIPRQQRRGNNVRAELGVAADALVVGAVGQLRPEKAFDVLVEVAGELVEQTPRLKVLIAGDGQERDTLEARVRALGLEDVVLLLGPRDDVPDVLAAVDVAVLCSTREGSPLSVMEYMAARRAIVATDVGGVSDLIEHDRHGVLVAPGDGPALTEAVRELLADPPRRARLGAAAAERQRAEFDFDVLVQHVEDLYEELFRRTRRARREHWDHA